MSKDDELLFWFSVFFTLVMVATVLASYLRQRQDLFTAWHMFLGGSALCVGFSGIYMTSKPHIFDYSSKTYELYYFGVVLFYVTVYATYYFFKFPAWKAYRHFRTCPPLSSSTMMLISLAALVVSVSQLVLVQIPGVSQILVRFGLLAPTFAVVFSFAAWFKNKANPVYVLLLIVVSGIAFYSAFSLGGGRRILYGTAFAFPLCFYWWKARYWKPTRVLALLAMLAVVTVLADRAYNNVRWYGVRNVKTLDRKEGAGARWGRFLDKLQNMDDFDFTRIGQQGTEHSFIAIRMYSLKEMGAFDQSPLHSLKVLITFPIPRALWEGKPQNLGLTLPFDSGVLAKGTRTNWGTSIVGHGYHEGVWVLVIYGILLGWALRYLDALLIQQPGNPFFLAFIATSSGHIIGWSRGDIASFTIWPIACFVLMILFLMFSQFVLGKRPYDPRVFT